MLWAGLGLLIAAAGIVLWPAQGLNGLFGGGIARAPGPLPEAPVASAPQAAASAEMPAAPKAEPAASAADVTPRVETVHSAPAPEAAASARGATITANEQSWVEIIDAGGRTLISRVVQPGEVVHLDGALPMRLKIGNAKATQLTFRGQAVDLDNFTRENVARVELK
jgi:cytoskeleton protein RodZ